MKRRMLLLALVLLAGSAVIAQDSKQEKPPSLMQMKLKYSQQILEGLSTENFEQIAKNARAMNGIGQLEQWFKADSPAYKTQLQVFRFANSELVRLAEEKNLDGASLAYLQTTISCVNCHKYIRTQAK
jgi:hypothetical protein